MDLRAACWSGNINHADARHGEIEGSLADIQRFAVGDLGRHPTVTFCLGVLLGEIKNGRRDIRGEDIAVGADAFGRLKRLVPGPGRNIEHAVAGFEVRHVQHGFRRGAQPRSQERAPCIPCMGGTLPLFTCRILVGDGVERGLRLCFRARPTCS